MRVHIILVTAGVPGPWDWQHAPAPAPSVEQGGSRELQNNNQPAFGSSGEASWAANISGIEFL